MAERPFAVYSRKSKLTEKGESIENQIAICRRYIASHFGEEAAERALIYEDEGFSGGSLRRPQFMKMMSDCKKSPFAAVTVYRLDRISRNIGDFAGLIEELGRMDTDFISVKEQFDTSSPMGRAMMYIASVFSQLERETIGERIRDNMRQLAGTGRWLGGVTPLGYASECVSLRDSQGKVRKHFRLAVKEDEAETVRLIFREYLKKGSLTAVEDLLSSLDYMTRQNKPFSRFGIKAILTNPVYMINDTHAYRLLEKAGAQICSPPSSFDGSGGVMVYNRTLQRPGHTHIINPPDQWIAASGEHRGLVSGALWSEVQDIISVNGSKKGSHSNKSEALLPGILFCSRCGSPMRPKLTGRSDSDGRPLFSYMCTLKEKSRGRLCNAANIRGNILDEAVMKYACSLPFDRELFVKALSETEKELCPEALSVKDMIAESEAKIRGLTSALACADDISRPYIMESIKADAMKIKMLRENDSRTYPQDVSAVELSIDTLPFAERKAAIRKLVLKVEACGDRAEITLAGAKNNAVRFTDGAL